MKIKRIILHIGSHKTGTTSIQRFMRKNSDYFLKKGVATAIHLGKIKTPNVSKTVGVILDRQSIETLNKTDAETLVVSSEAYSWLNEQKYINEFVNELKKYAAEVSVIVYFRRQDKQAISHKQEGTKWGACSEAFGHDLKALPNDLNQLAKDYLNYDRKYTMWSEATKNRVTARIFDRSCFYKNDLILDFLECCEIDIGNDVGKELILPSISNNSIYHQQQLFLHKIAKHFPLGSKQSKWITRIVAFKLEGSGTKLLPSRGEAEMFYDQFQESNSRLFQKLHPGDEGRLFDEDFTIYPEVGNEYEMTSDQIIEMFSKVIIYYLSSKEAQLGEKSKNSGPVKQIRNMATKLEGTNLSAAVHLMQAAQILRPERDQIKNKLKAYQQRLNKTNKPSGL